MRSPTTAALLSVLCALLLSCDQKQSSSNQLVVYMYSEYHHPEMPEQFEKLTGYKLRIDSYEASEEMLAKLQHGSAGQYDVIVVSDVVVPALIKLGLVQPLDPAKIPNAKNVAEQFRNPQFDPQNRYSLPYQWGTVGLMYSKDAVKSSELSWDLIFDPAKQPGPFILMDSMRDMLGIALKYQGRSMNSRNREEVNSAGQLLANTKKSPKSLGFEGGVGGKNGVMSGRAALAVVYNGDAIQAAAENDKVAFAVPREGGVIWVDVMMVTAKSRKADVAHKFIDYILDPKVGTQLSNFKRYATPNVAALPMIRPEDRSNPGIYPPEETIKKLEYLQDLDKDTALYDEAWSTLKAR